MRYKVIASLITGFCVSVCQAQSFWASLTDNPEHMAPSSVSIPYALPNPLDTSNHQPTDTNEDDPIEQWLLAESQLEWEILIAATTPTPSSIVNVEPSPMQTQIQHATQAVLSTETMPIPAMDTAVTYALAEPTTLTPSRYEIPRPDVLSSHPSFKLDIDLDNPLIWLFVGAGVLLGGILVGIILALLILKLLASHKPQKA